MERMNIGILAHVDAGKTTITEQILYQSGSTRTLGSVDAGTTQTDFLGIERQRGISVKSASISVEWKGVRINLMDTPGHTDFAGEVERSLFAVDGVILVVCAVEGVQAHTSILWEALRAMKIPTLVFVNKLDREGADFARVCQQLKTELSMPIVPLVDQPAKGKTILKPNLADVLLETAAEIDDSLAQAFLEERTPPFGAVSQAFCSMVQNLEAVPVLSGCGKTGDGIPLLLDAITDYFPRADQSSSQLGDVVYKVEHDKAMGKVAHVRLYGGSISNRDAIAVQGQKETEKVSQIRRIQGAKQIDCGRVDAGDIAALCGLSHIKTGDKIGTFFPKAASYQMAVPLLKVQVFPEDPALFPALSSALEELGEEDPLLDVSWLSQEKELHISITGKIQLEVLQELILQRYGLSVHFSAPSVIYKETPLRSGEGFVAYTMPKPCWAVLRFAIEPLPRGSGVVYQSVVAQRTLPIKYQNHVRSCIPQVLKQGLYGWEVTDLKITLIDGGHHLEHTHPLDFFVATPMAVMDGLAQCGTTLLEPLVLLRIRAGEEYIGTIIRDVLDMRGEFDTPVFSGGSCTLECRVPVATSIDYATQLRSLTGGRAAITSRFYGYRPCPLELGKTAKRIGINPLDRSKWILHARHAL